MDTIWDRKSFEVRGHWPSGGDEKTNDNAELTKVERLKKKLPYAITFVYNKVIIIITTYWAVQARMVPFTYMA